MRSCDIAARCREIALRVQCSGEWGELAETLTQAATEVERLRLLPSVQEEIVAWSVDLHDAREEIKRLKAEVERLRLRPEEMDALSWCRDVMPKMWEPCAVVQIHSEVCGKMLKRLGGGE